MFPCSSNIESILIDHTFSLANQNLSINGHEINTTTFQIDHYDQNPIMISSHHDQCYHHHRQQKDSSPHSHNTIPPIFEDDGVILSHLLSQQQLLSSNTVGYSQALPDEISAVVTNALPEVSDHGSARVHDDHRPMKGQCSKKQREKPIPRKRTTGKDRHSKISTAQGLRGRRMRLSLQIARRFFDLQDMLGFDKASRTIEWLFAKSKTAIKELKDSFLVSSANSTSESEVVARIMENIGPENDDEASQFATSMPKDEKKMKKIYKVVARESRDKARARARERTREKMLEKTKQVSRSTDTSVTISEAENHSSELKGEEEITCHSDLKMADPRFGETNLINQLGLEYYPSLNGANFEEDGLGFCESWDFITAPKAQNPSSLFMSITGTASSAQNPNSVLMEIKNPNPIFSMPSSGTLEIDHGEHNSATDLLAGSDIFCSLNF